MTSTITEPRTLLRTTEAARRLGLSRSWLEKLRLTGDGPTFVRVGSRAIAYWSDDLMRWADSRPRFRSTSEATSEASAG